MLSTVPGSRCAHKPKLKPCPNVCCLKKNNLVLLFLKWPQHVNNTSTRWPRRGNKYFLVMTLMTGFYGFNCSFDCLTPSYLLLSLIPAAPPLLRLLRRLENINKKCAINKSAMIIQKDTTIEQICLAGEAVGSCGADRMMILQCVLFMCLLSWLVREPWTPMQSLWHTL